MANTPNLGLHQWNAGDAFLRTDFNEDFGKIDAAVGRTEGKTEQALAGLAHMGYNVHNLMLQNYYAAKYTGFRRGLVFDGFLDGNGVASLSPGGWIENRMLHFCGGTQTLPIEENFGTGAKYHLTKYTPLTRSWPSTGHGKITSVTLYIECGYSSHACSVTMNSGSRSASASIPLTSSTQPQRHEFLFSPPLIVRPGEQINMTVGHGYDYPIEILGARANENFGCRMVGQGTAVPNAMCTMKPYDVGDDYSGAWAWVRYETAPPALTLKNAAGKSAAMALLGTTPGKTLDNGDCMEAAYRLDTAPPGPNRMATLVIDMAGAGANRVIDYGIVFA